MHARPSVQIPEWFAKYSSPRPCRQLRRSSASQASAALPQKQSALDLPQILHRLNTTNLRYYSINSTLRCTILRLPHSSFNRRLYATNSKRNREILPLQLNQPPADHECMLSTGGPSCTMPRVRPPFSPSTAFGQPLSASGT